MQSRPPRRPGEVLFNLAMLTGSLFLLWSAYGISGFEALSAPGTVPMVASGAMAICAALVLWETLRKPGTSGETVAQSILPLTVIVTIAMIVGYALVLQWLGFLPTSFLFLTVMIRFLARRRILNSALLAAGIVLAVWLVFRVVFTVLMPPGLVPEAEIVAFFRNLMSGR